MSLDARAPIKRISLEQTVIRKDGTVEDRGIVAYYHVNPICRLLFQIERLTSGTGLARFARARRESYERLGG